MAFALHATGGELPAHPVDALVEVVEEEHRGHNLYFVKSVFRV